MANKTEEQKKDSSQSTSFSLQEYITECLSRWKWFVASVLIFVCIGMLYTLRKPPMYSRTMSVLIKDPEQGSGLDIKSAFAQFGFGGGNTNVYNELISLKSPAVMSEVVKRLQLNVWMTQKGTFHGTALFGSNNPVALDYPGLDEDTKFSFRIKLQPDNTFLLYKFASTSPKGAVTKYDKEVSGRLGDTPVATPVGKMYLRPNTGYAETRSEDVLIYVNVSSYAYATEHYVALLSGDLVDTDADVIDLSINDTNTERANAILNSVVDVYSEYWLQDKNKVNVATSKFITERLVSLTEELGGIDRHLADFQSANKLLFPEETARAFTQQATLVDENLLTFSNQLAMARYVRDFVAKPANRLSIIPVTTGLGPSALEASIQEYNRILLGRENLIQNSGESNPIIREYDTQLNGLRESIMSSLASQIGTLETSVKTMNSALNRSDDKLSNLPRQSQKLVSAMREQTVMEALYIFLLQKREEADIQQAFTVSNVRVITPPYGSRKPIGPNKPMALVISLMLGILLPATIVYFIVVSNDKVQSRHDLDNLPLPFVGEIPQVGKRNRLREYLSTKKQRQAQIDKPKPIVEEGKRDVANEAFRVVRSNIELMMHSGTSDKILAVTSFNPGSGKSFIVYNIGASFALKRMKVLLVDGDLRHGSLSTYVGSPRRGLTSYLQNHTGDLDALTQRVDGFGSLYVMPIGHKPPNPAELLEGARFKQFIDQARAEYDIVIIDCPPVNVVVDTQIINRFADSTIFVVRAGLLKKSAISDIVTLYNDKRLINISLLLNGTTEAQSSYYSYGNYDSYSS